MGFWVAFAVWFVTGVVTALLTKPKDLVGAPSGLDDFSVPTATEGRSVPVIVGKMRVTGPNVIWWGDLDTVRITQKTGGFLGIGRKRVTIGYKYYLGLQMALCRGPIDGIDRVWIGDKVVKEDGETGPGNIVISKADLFGGKKAGGGVVGTLEWYDGTQTTVNSYLTEFQPQQPSYKGTVYFVFTNQNKDGPAYIGNASNLRTFAFEPYWYPNSLGVTGGKERIGDDANPVCFLYEMLVASDDWGIGFNASDMLVTGTVEQGALRAVAEQVADEGLGFSYIINSPVEVRELIQMVERHIDGAFRLDLTDGRYKMILARTPATSPAIIDETAIQEMKKFERGNWGETKNEVRITYSDRDKDYDRTFAFDFDTANLDLMGQRNIATLSFPGVKDATTANKIAARELVYLSFPFARGTIVCDRSVYAFQRGDPFRLTWPDEDINQLNCRVSRVKYGNDRDQRITIDWVEDVFKLETVGFVDPPETDWEPPVNTALDVVPRLWIPPAQLETTEDQVIVLAARPNGLHIGFDVYAEYDAGGYVLRSEAFDNDWCVTAQLAGALTPDLSGGGADPYTGDIDVDNLSAADLELLQEASETGTLDTDQYQNLILIGDEVLWFEGVTYQGGGVYRLTNCRAGVFGTYPQAHADNSIVYFFGLGVGVVETDGIEGSPTAVRVKLSTITSSDQLDIASATATPYLTYEDDIPYTPGDLTVNSEKVASDNFDQTVLPLDLTWKRRDRNSQAVTTLQGDASLASVGNGVTIELRRVDTDAVLDTKTDNTGTTDQFSIALPQTNPGVADETDLYIRFWQRDGAKTSQVWQTKNFEIVGFGLEFGSAFGGQP